MLGEIGSLGTMCNVAQTLTKNGITGQGALPSPGGCDVNNGVGNVLPAGQGQSGASGSSDE
eukprot:6540466-Karenia_brevis.AAC.1